MTKRKSLVSKTRTHPAVHSDRFWLRPRVSETAPSMTVRNGTYLTDAHDIDVADAAVAALAAVARNPEAAT